MFLPAPPGHAPPAVADAARVGTYECQEHPGYLPTAERGLITAAVKLPSVNHETNKQIVADAFLRWAQGTGSVFDLLADDVTWTVTGSSAAAGTYTSRMDFLRDAVRPISIRLSTPIVPTVRSIVADDDWVVVLWQGDALANDGVDYRNVYSWHLRLDENAIVEAIAFLDGSVIDALFARVPVET